MTLRTVAVNGMALEDYSLLPIALDEWLSAPAVKVGTLQLLDRSGLTPTTHGIQWTPRTLHLGVQAPQTGSLATNRNLLGTWYMAALGLLELEMLDAPGRVCYGIFEASVGDVFGKKLLHPSVTSIGTITCHDPFWYDRAPVSFGGTTATRYVVPVAHAPSKFRLQIVGPYTNPTVTLRDRSGNSLATMRFTDTAADGKTYLDLDFDAMTCTKCTDAAGVAVRTVNASLLNSADPFFACDPLDAPTLEVSSGTFTGQVWRAYLV